MIRHIVLIVSGKVQGVFYRASSKQKADELGICGVVHNLPDGSVYIEAEGFPEQLELFRSWCEVGPPRAVVTRIDTRDGELKNYKDYKVLR